MWFHVGAASGLVLGAVAAFGACGGGPSEPEEPMGVLPTATTTAEPLWIPFRFRAGEPVDPDPREGRLTELRRLTDDGRSGRAAWHPSGRAVVFERRDESGCAVLVTMDLGSGATAQVTPAGACASSPVYRGAELVHAVVDGPKRCAPLWQLSPALSGCELRGPGDAALAPAAGFDGEPHAADGVVVFTSLRDGDAELYRLEEGTPMRLTSKPGYDGGAALSPDGTRLAWHGALPAEPPGEAARTEGGADEGAARPSEDEPSESPDATADRAAAEPAGAPGVGPLVLWLAGSEGQHPRVVVHRGRKSLDPAFLSDSRRLLFASDYDAPRDSSALDLYLVDPEGPETAAGGPPIERVTYAPGYDGEARVSPDGEHVLFTSSRGGEPWSRNLFVARLQEAE